MSDERPEPPSDEDALPASRPDGPTEPAPEETLPIVPRRLPSAESFFGAPRPPRHSTRAEAPSVEIEPPAGDGTSVEEPELAEPAVAEPAVDEPAVESDSQPVSESAAHPQALDLSGLVDVEPLAESHETDSASESVAQSSSAEVGSTEPSFTELISVPTETAVPVEAPTAFDWRSSRPESGEGEPEPRAPQRATIEPDLQQDTVTAPIDQPLEVAPVGAEPGASDELVTPAESASAAVPESLRPPDEEVEDDPFALLFGDIADEEETDVEPETHEESSSERVDVLEPDDELPERAEDDPSAWADVPVTPLPPVMVVPQVDDDGAQTAPVGAHVPPVGSEKAGNDAPTALLPTPEPPLAEPAEPDAPTAVVPAATPSPFAPGSFLSAKSRLGRNTPVDPVDPNRVPESWVAAQTPAAEGSTKGDGGSDSSGVDRRILILIGVVVAFLVVLVLLFFLGRAISTRGAEAASPSSPSAASTAVPSPSPSSTASAAPSASSVPPEAMPSVSTPAAAGPVSPGTHQWTDLNGGECVSAFQSAWQQTYSVVDCATPHAAQLVAKATLPDAAGTAYPGDTALQGRMTLLCSSSTVIDLGAAKAYSDIQVSGSYPSRASDWTAGDRTYYCFVSRANGATLTGSLAAGA